MPAKLTYNGDRYLLAPTDAMRALVADPNSAIPEGGTGFITIHTLKRNVRSLTEHEPHDVKIYIGPDTKIVIEGDIDAPPKDRKVVVL